MDTASQRSAGVIMCTIRNGAVHVLLMVQDNSRYGRSGNDKIIDIGAKGALEKGEDEVAAALREAEEETGVRPAIEKGFREVAKYYYEDVLWKTGRMTRIGKSVTYFLALLTSRQADGIRMSHEHVSCRFVGIDDAIGKVRKAGQKRVLRKVREYAKARGWK